MTQPEDNTTDQQPPSPTGETPTSPDMTSAPQPSYPAEQPATSAPPPVVPELSAAPPPPPPPDPGQPGPNPLAWQGTASPAPMPPVAMSEAAASEDTQTWQVPVTPPAAPPPPPPAPPTTWQQPTQIAAPAPQPVWQQPAAPAPQPAAPAPQPAWQQPAAPPPPAQNWQQPPPPQQWPQQQPYAQQQPYGQQYPQQPYGQPYGQAYGAPALPYSTSPVAWFAGLLLLVFGLGVIALGVFTITQGQEIARFIDRNDIAIFGSTLSRDTLRSVLSPSPGILIVVGVLHLLAGLGVFSHRSAGRWFGFLLALVGLLVSVVAVSLALALSGGFSVAAIICVVLLVGYALICLALLAGGKHFHRQTVTPRQ